MNEEELALITLGQAESRERMHLLELSGEDEKLIVELAPIFEEHGDRIVLEFYEHLLSFEGVRRFFPGEEELRRVQKLQSDYFKRLVQGNYDQEYIDGRLRIGRVYHRVGLHPKWYLGMYNWYLRRTVDLIDQHYPGDHEKRSRLIKSVSKLFFFDMELAIEAYVATGEEESTRIIRRQAEAVMELSTPVVQIWDGILALPLVGAIDSARAQSITETVLERVISTKARAVLIDITGVPVVDTMVASHLIKTMAAARLLGAESVIVGISPQIAHTLVHLGIDLGQVKTFATLKAGLRSVIGEE